MKTSVLLILALHLSRNSKDPIFYPTFKETLDMFHANFTTTEDMTHAIIYITANRMSFYIHIGCPVLLITEMTRDNPVGSCAHSKFLS